MIAIAGDSIKRPAPAEEPRMPFLLHDAGPAELALGFDGLDAWQAWIREHPAMRSPQRAEEMLAAIRRDGVVEPLSGAHFPANEVVIEGRNYRETVRAGRLNSRVRGLLLVLSLVAQQGRPILLQPKARVYAPEALTGFALYMRGRYPRFLGSEYAQSAADAERLFPIPVQDLQRLTFADASFDLMVANDVFEHVPDLDQVLRETRRILAPRGVLLSTFPFLADRAQGVVKARLRADGIEYLSQPEYHGNPTDPAKGSLVFEVPGWDIVDRARKAGFARTHMCLVSSVRHGVLGAGLNGVFVLVAERD
jgi:SAM-dependent methyltransferase